MRPASTVKEKKIATINKRQLYFYFLQEKMQYYKCATGKCHSLRPGRFELQVKKWTKVLPKNYLERYPHDRDIAHFAISANGGSE